MSFKKLSVIGLGYIGLPTAVLFASKGLNVLGVDINESLINELNKGTTSINEPDLDRLLSDSVESRKFSAAMTVAEADVFLIAVPTPFKMKDSSMPTPDLTFVHNAVSSITPFLQKGNLVLLESTCPIGTTEEIAKIIQNERPDLVVPSSIDSQSDISIAYCPERVLPGKIMEELVSNDRVIGGITNKCSKKAEEFYKLAIDGNSYLTDSRTAEMVKLAENASRDVNIAFANELSMICEDSNINVWDLISMTNKHPRVNILEPGPGVGGHCIAVDPWFLISRFENKSKIMRSAREVNLDKEEWVINKINESIKEFKKTSNDITISCFGLAFKANVSDMRESPAHRIFSKLSAIHEGLVYAVEPNISNISEYPEIKFMSADEAISKSDIIVLLVNHNEFYSLEIPNGKKIIDTRGIWRD